MKTEISNPSAAPNVREASMARSEAAQADARERAPSESANPSRLPYVANPLTDERTSNTRLAKRSTRIVRCDLDMWPDQPGVASSRSKRLGRWLSIAGALACSIGAAHAQGFSIDWCTLDGGGGTSSGGHFSLSGTIGQPEASAQPMTGGNFSLTGGFWSVVAVQTPNAPRLDIQRLSATSAQVVWPSPSTGFLLQQVSDLSTANWINVPQAVSDDGANRFITVDLSMGLRFYRLLKP